MWRTFPLLLGLTGGCAGDCEPVSEELVLEDHGLTVAALDGLLAEGSPEEQCAAACEMGLGLALSRVDACTLSLDPAYEPPSTADTARDFGAELGSVSCEASRSTVCQ